MARPQIQIGDEVREMTKEEFAAYELHQADIARETTEQVRALEAATTARTSARTKLAALGLTDDEINALLGA